MGTQPLGLKLTRRIARDVGQPIKRAVGHGGYDFEFVTFDHEHGVWSKRDGTWSLVGPGGDGMHPPMHWASCRWNFPDTGGSEQWAAAEPPEHWCGARAVMHGLDLLCAEPTEHIAARKPHRCGSETWALTPDDDPPGVPIERYL